MTAQRIFRTFWFIPILALAIALGCGSSRPDISAVANENNEIRVYEVFGMDCPGCHDGLEKLVNEIPEVVTSKANWEKQRLQVVLKSNSNVDDAIILSAIEKANFTAGKRLQ
ncbi:MAG: cation transporter [Candidatus Zixiibacteriota bacterium]|nr:MAG: cation transporter [candidate division Zixibacteria bacterium]